MITALTLVVLLGSPPSQPPAAKDDCRSRIAPEVVALIAARYPHHRLPVDADDLADDRSYDLEHGGIGCLRIASGDFDGDHRQDVAVLLTPFDSSLDAPVPLVVARHRKGKWILEELYEFSSGSLYVESTPPGSFSRSEATDADHDEFDHNEVRHFKSTRTGLIAGRIGANGAAFLYTPRRWVHVWISY